jgi:DNA-binding SARP family transcriptional activator
MSKLNLSLLGKPRIEKDGKPVEINRRKATALLTYLAVTGEMQSREKLASLFWPHEPHESSRAALRRTLTAIRRAVGNEWLVAEGEKVGMKLGGELWLDVNHFDALLQKYREISVPGDAESAESLALLTEVAKLYRTDFLSQFALDSNTDFSEWQFFQTESLRRKFADTLARLVEGHAKQQEFELAIAYARRRLSLDPLEEECHRSLMRLYAASGHETLALRQFKDCEKRLQKELGVEPDPLTRALLEDIKARLD